MAASTEVSAYQDFAARRMQMGEFIRSFGDSQFANESLFVFDMDPDLFEGHDGGYRKYIPSMEKAHSRDQKLKRGQLGKDFTTPVVFKEFLKREGTGWNMLSLSDSDHGLGFHAHGKSWIALVFGTKRWWVYAPGTMPKRVSESLSPLASMAAWAKEYDALAAGVTKDEEKPHTCTQHAGEAFYLPAGWAHATCPGPPGAVKRP